MAGVEAASGVVGEEDGGGWVPSRSASWSEAQRACLGMNVRMFPSGPGTWKALDKFVGGMRHVPGLSVRQRAVQRAHRGCVPGPGDLAGAEPLTQGLKPRGAVQQAGMRGRPCQEGLGRSGGRQPRGRVLWEAVGAGQRGADGGWAGLPAARGQ